MPHFTWLLALVFLCPLQLARADEIGDLLKDIRNLHLEKNGSAKTRAAWDKLVRQGPSALPRILEAMDTNDTVVANWLRLAFEQISDRETSRDKKLTRALMAFVRDKKRNGRARRFALGVVEKSLPGTSKNFIATWLDDPEFRFDAIEQLLEEIRSDKDLPKEKVVAALRRAFAASRDLEQSRRVGALLAEQGVKVSVAAHMGFLGDWYVIGPFDGKGRTGFRTVYPPEKKVDLTETLSGKNEKKLQWQRHTVAEQKGGRFPILVDLRKPLGEAEDAVAYAWTAFNVAEARTVEFRGSGDDNLSVFVNGEKVFAFEEYYNGVRLDRHRFTVKLKLGRNTVLVKICQAPRDPDNSDPNWEFLLRITDTAGKGLTFPSALKQR